MIIPAILLLSLSTLVIYSSSPELAIAQFIFGVVGVILFVGLRFFDYRSLKRLIIPMFVIIVVLLLITLFLGNVTRGSARWIPIGPFNLQPSEFAKPVLILALGVFWSSRKATWINIGKSVLILLPFALLVFRQPDLGTALTLSAIWFSILIAANVSMKKLLMLVMAAIIVVPIGWSFLHDYQRNRIESFLSPTNDPQGIGFHVIQSMIAVGSGELTGRGIGLGTQSRLQFLPEFQTDFIFAFIAEELGFVGSVLVLVLYAVLFYFLYRLLSKSRDKFGELIIVGVMGMILFQMVVNIGMNTGIMPITGITLPFLSYGGSSIVTTFISLGLVSSVARYGLKRKEVDTFSVID
jgi:rod shape determining protein RodA